MENIIKKAQEGGYEYGKPFIKGDVLNRNFWIALGKSCGWTGKVCLRCGSTQSEATKFQLPHCEECDENEEQNPKLFVERHIDRAMRFHEINLTEGWEQAIKYLESITSQSLN